MLKLLRGASIVMACALIVLQSGCAFGARHATLLYPPKGAAAAERISEPLEPDDDE